MTSVTNTCQSYRLVEHRISVLCDHLCFCNCITSLMLANFAECIYQYVYVCHIINVYNIDISDMTCMEEIHISENINRLPGLELNRSLLFFKPSTVSTFALTTCGIFFSIFFKRYLAALPEKYMEDIYIEFYLLRIFEIYAYLELFFGFLQPEFNCDWHQSSANFGRLTFDDGVLFHNSSALTLSRNSSAA